MKKVIGNAAKYIFAAFTIAVFAMLISLTYQALQRIFPTSFENQIIGLVLFDIGAICWALAFVYLCQTTGQYAAAVIGFLTAFIGTLGMVAAEVVLAGKLVTVDPQQIGEGLVFGFIAVTALHVTMIYTHHAAAPDIREKIDVGIARGEIVTEAISQATKQLDAEKANLAKTITVDIVSQVKRDLGLYPINDTVFDRRKKLEADTVPLPILTETQALNLERAKQGLAPLNVPDNDPPFYPQDEPKPAKPPFLGSPSE